MVTLHLRYSFGLGREAVKETVYAWQKLAGLEAVMLSSALGAPLANRKIEGSPVEN